jgi:hypothetical protein
MVIIETSIFTKQITDLLSDDEYRSMQLALVENPTLGSKEPGTGGLRKIRIPAQGHGKRGGARIIYFWSSARDQLLLLYVFPKGSRAQLTERQKKILKKIVDEEYQ